MQNNQFLASIKSLRRTLPTLGWGMLALVYGVSAIAGGAFLANLMDNEALAYAIAIAIQATRAVIVFFPQMNPSRPTFGWGGEAAAIIFGGLSIYEMYTLINGSYNEAVFVSVAVLMFAGIIIEILMLKEVKYATEQELLSDPKQYEAIRKLYSDRYRLQEELAKIKEGEALFVAQEPAETAPPAPVANLPNERLVPVSAQLVPVAAPATRLNGTTKTNTLGESLYHE